MLDTPPSEILFFFVLVTSIFVYRDYILDCTLMEFMVDESLNLDADRAQSGTDHTSKAKLYINCRRDTYIEKNLWIPGVLNWQWIHRDGFVVDCLHMAGCPKGTFTFADAARVSFKLGFKRLAI